LFSYVLSQCSLHGRIKENGCQSPLSDAALFPLSYGCLLDRVAGLAWFALERQAALSDHHTFRKAQGHQA
jgi:hypothetical protein